MGSVAIIIVSLLIVLGLVYYLIYRRNKRHLKAKYTDWKKFETAVANNDVKKINHYGMLLVWNVYLEPKQLDLISENVELRIKDHPDLERLRLAILNKKLHWNRSLPYPS